MRNIFTIVKVILSCVVLFIVIYTIMDYRVNDDLITAYDDLGGNTVSNMNKSLQFLETYTALTGDTSLAVATGLSEDDAMAIANGGTTQTTGDGSTTSTTVPTNVTDLLATLKAAQGSDPGSLTSCNNTFRLLYPNTTETYSSLKSFNSTTEAIIKSLNEDALTQVSVNVWRWVNPDPDSSDFSKTSATIKVQCAKTLAPLVEQIFAEIYADSSQPVVGDVGGYNVRGKNNTDSNSSSSTSTHSYGGTIDVNYSVQGSSIGWNWNYGGQPYPRSQTTWSALPENQYKYDCIYDGCVIMTIFEKYGFYWGGSYSAKYCDPMHFSVFDH